MIKRFCALILALFMTSVFPASAETSFMRYTSDYFGTVSMLRLYETEGAQETWTASKDCSKKSTVPYRYPTKILTSRVSTG